MYDPYDEYMASIAPQDFAPAQSARRYSRGRARSPAMPQSAEPSFFDYANLGLGVGGTLLGAYGTYQAGEQAAEQHKDAMAAYRDERDREARLDDINEGQRQLGNTMGFANYARDLEKDVYGTYSPWARRQGL